MAPEKSSSATEHTDETENLSFGPAVATQLVMILFPIFFVGGIGAMILGFKKPGWLLIVGGFGMLIAGVLMDLVMQALFFGVIKAGQWIAARWSL